MAQVIVYENGNAIGGEGHPTYARDITFENEGTDLEAEKVQAAIVEVNDKTKHGIVELWKNSSPANQMAGQTIQIANFDVDLYDAIVIPIEKQAGEVLGSIWYEFDVEMFKDSALVTSVDFMTMIITSFKIQRIVRNYTISMVGTTLNIQLGDNTLFETTGGTPTSSTNNYFNIPYRVLGLIHND